MTFDLSAAQTALQNRARAFADAQVAPSAAAIDERGVLPVALVTSLAAEKLVDGVQVDRAIAIEEVAVASSAAGAVLALGPAAAGPSAVPGLRGVRHEGTALTAMQRVGLAAVAVGIGRAALEEAVHVMKAAGERPTGGVAERPHWVLADAATETDAARLFLRRAAQRLDQGRPSPDADAAAAQVYASGAAERTVAAALRVIGPEAYRQGTRLERLSRDARSLALAFGTEEELRAIVALATLPE